MGGKRGKGGNGRGIRKGNEAKQDKRRERKGERKKERKTKGIKKLMERKEKTGKRLQ